MTLALGIRYLNGWSMAASDGAKKDVAEWPPHPDRVFMALAAAHFEGDRSDETRGALEWLEHLPAPSIVASEAAQREIVTHYVPVNDAAAPSVKLDRLERVSSDQVRDGLSLLPENRSRQPRQFPVSIPHEDTVYLIWHTNIVPENCRAALSALCSQVTAVGHSASLVQMWVADEPPVANWTPTDIAADHRFRVPVIGRLSALESAYNESGRVAWFELERSISQTKGKARKALKEKRMTQFADQPPIYRRPSAGLWAGYAQDAAEAATPLAAHGVFSSRILVFRYVGGRRLGLESTLLVTDVFREYVLQKCPKQPPPEWISGHALDGTPTRHPHLGFFPMPHVGYEHAQGHLLGLALAVPNGIAPDEVGRCLEPLFQLDDRGEAVPFKLYRGDLLESSFQFDLVSDAPLGLRPGTWTGPPEGACTWASVTPVVLDRHGKSGDIWADAEETIKLACERAGLPQPAHVVLGPVSHFIGAPSSRNAPRLMRKDGGNRHHVHAVLTFSTPVRGPILIGAGRFRGYGLCRPWPPISGRRG